MPNLSRMLIVALICTIVQLPVAVAASWESALILDETTSLNFLPDAIDQEELSSSSAPLFTLPSRSNILSSLLNYYHDQNNRNLEPQSRAKLSSLNQIFSQVSLKLPDAKVSKSGLDLTITELVCRELNVNDITLTHSIQSNTSQKINVDISGIYINCSFRWEYKWSIFNGQGSGTARLDPSSSASLDLQFISENYDTHPPKDVSVPHCGPNIQIADMDFDGDGIGIIGGIISLFEGLLRDTIEDELGGTVCDELRGLGDAALDDLLIMLSGEVESYLKPLEGNMTDPLFAENTMTIPMIDNDEENSVDPKPLYINFQGLEDYAGEWVTSALEQVNSYMGPDESKPFRELGINTFIRDNFLNENGTMTIDPSLFFESGIVFEGHDMLTETTMSIKSIQMEGLDSFQEMDLMNAIGKHTLQNKFRLDYLWIVVEMEAEMKASSKADAIIVANGNVPPITEQFTVSFSMSDIEIDASIFLGINTQMLGSFELGSMLHSENILPCLISAVDEAKFTGLSLTVQDIVPPKLSGFLDSGIDNLISTGTTALFEMYEKVFIKAMPNFFETFVRDMVNEFVEDALTVYKCPENEDVETDKYIDFRDMFKPATEAALAGGSGDGRYGNIIPWVMNIVEDQLFSASDNGLFAINEMFIVPWTKSQSGMEGAFRINGTFVDLNKEEVTRDIWKAFADKLRLTLSDLSVTGLDTIRNPFKMLQPRASSAHLLENQLSLGIPNKPLGASFQFGIEVGGATSPLATNNVMDLQFSMPSMDVLAVLFATMQESRFMKFPLRDALNFSCWLSMIPSSDMSPGVDVGIAMHYLDVVFDVLANTTCVSCSNSWLEGLDSVVDFLDENKFISGLKSRALSIGMGLLKGDWVQGMVDKQIVQASQSCPHDASFASVMTDQTYPTFKATRDLVDGVLYAAFPLVQVIALFIAQKHSSLEIATPAELELNVPDGANLIDLTDLSSIAGWADMALGEARSYLGGKVDGSQDLGITSMLRSLILDDNGLMTIPIVDEGFEAGGVKLSLDQVTMAGLDSFTLFEVLKVRGPSTFSNSVKLKRLGVTVKMGLSVQDESTDQADTLLERGINANEIETITVSLILKDVELDVSLLMAMDQDLMGGLKLGSILDTNHIFTCLLSTIHSVGLSEFVMDIGDIEEFTIDGFISEDTNNSMQSITQAIFTEYKSTIVDAIPAFTSTTIRPILHDILQVLVEKARDDGACPEPDSSLDSILDWRDLLLSEEMATKMLGQGYSPYGNLFRMLYNFLENIMSEADDNGLSKMNDLVTSLTERQSGEGGDLYYPGDIFKQDLDIALNGLNAAIELGVSDVRVSNIDSLGTPIKMLQLVEGEPSILDNTALIGAGSKALKVEFRLLIKGKGNKVEVHNDLVLGLSLKSVDMLLELLAQIEEVPFLNFPLQDVLNLQCWLATVVTPVLDTYGIRVGEPNSGIVVRNLALAVAEARLDIECISCSSPLIVEMASTLGLPESIAGTTDAANMIFDYITNLLGGDFIQAELDKMLTEAAMQCPHSSSYNQNFAGLKFEGMVAPQKEGDSHGFLIAIISVIAISAVFAAVVFVASRFVSKRRHNRWMDTLTRAQKLDLEKVQTEDKEREKDLNSRMRSLVRSKEVPLFLRLFIPIVILGNIALFLSGHLSVGGTVNISGAFAGQPFNVDKFFEFSMAKSTIEMWNAGAKVLAILIVIFSGVWPYSKLLATLAIWFAPPRWLSSKRRGSTLNWLDVLGKWSMVDVFVLLMTLASFRVSVESPDHLSFLPEGLYSINMLVVPLWGLYANMLAQFVAQISSHVIIHYNRKTIRVATRAQEVEWGLPPSNLDDETPEKLGLHMFSLDYEASSERAMVRRSVHWILSATLLSFMLLVICGCVFPSFSMEVLGVVGLVVESGNQFEQAKVLYSVFDLATMIMDQARYLNTASDFAGHGTLASLLVITVFLVPLAQAASLLVQWFVPMTKKQRSQNMIVNECLSAWQYMEVYVLSIVIAAWQLGGVSEYMINEYCGSLTDTFNSLSYYGILSEDDAQCFRVNAKVETASWILVAASLILCILNHFISGASSQKAQDDDIPPERRLHSDRWLWSKLPAVTVGVSASGSMDEEDCSCGLDVKHPSVAMIQPRFTDYYFFATRRRSDDPVQDHGAETAVLSATGIETGID